RPEPSTPSGTSLANCWTALAAPNASATFATAAIAGQGEAALVDCALTLAAQGRPVTAVCRALDVARSNVHTRQARVPDWRDGRCSRAQASDAELLAELRKHILELPSYGYRRACALLNRQRAASGLPRVNHKRVYRVMARNDLLLPKAPRRRQSSRPHTGTVAVSASDRRWCSDGFEIKCDSGQTVTATFAKDCCDRRHPGLARLGRQRAAGRASAGDAHRGSGKTLWRCRSDSISPPAGVLERQRFSLRFEPDPCNCSPAGTQAHQYTGVQPAEQRHGRELRQHVSA
ncbi:MAG: Integrase catalytic region, partial [Polaromonas sp.]|nr:Integrase catalytic region [Polaromonas sp.]